MKKVIFILGFFTVCLTISLSCSKKPSNCSDNNTIALVKKVILERIYENDNVSGKTTNDNLNFRNIKESRYDDKSRRYICKAELIVGDIYNVSIDYESFFDNNHQNMVIVSALMQQDMAGIKNNLFNCTGLDKFCHSAEGLNWSDKSANRMSFKDAEIYCQKLGGRLPTISELRTLLQNSPKTETAGSCGVTDNCLSYNECYNSNCGPLKRTTDGSYSKFGDIGALLSSSKVSDTSEELWYVGFDMGYLYNYSINDGYVDVRCVR